MIRVDMYQVIFGLKAAVDESGEDYIYPHAWYDDQDPDLPSPRYIVPGTTNIPACLIARALTKSGVFTPRLLKYETQIPSEFLVQDENGDATPEVFGAFLKSLNRAQQRQDDQIPWGDVYREFADDIAQRLEGADASAREKKRVRAAVERTRAPERAGHKRNVDL